MSELLSYSKLLFIFADTQDKLIIFLGFSLAIISGAALPRMIFLLGEILNEFEGEGGSLAEAIKPTILTFVCLGIAAWIFNKR